MLFELDVPFRSPLRRGKLQANVCKGVSLIYFLSLFRCKVPYPSGLRLSRTRLEGDLLNAMEKRKSTEEQYAVHRSSLPR